jgi:hypothetical protein
MKIKYLKEGNQSKETPRPPQFKEEIRSVKMAGAALVAEPAKTAPCAAAVPPAGQWKKRGKNLARQARAHV